MSRSQATRLPRDARTTDASRSSSAVSSAALALTLVLALGCGGTTPEANGDAQGRLYHRLGGMDSLRLVVDEWIGAAAANPVIQDRFAAADISRLKRHLVEYLCVAAGGPCRYEGRDIDDVHRPMGLSRKDASAFLRDLRAAVATVGVDDEAGEELVRRIASLTDQVVR